MQDRQIHLLHLEDSKVDHELVKFTLRRNGMPLQVVRCETLDEFKGWLSRQRFDAILADYRLAGFTAMEAWDVVLQQAWQPPFIILSGAIGEAAAVEAMRRGVSDYLLKDSMSKLEYVIRRAIEANETRLAKLKADAELADSEHRLAELTEHLQTSIEQERAAIAREIHDDIGGSLAAVKLDLAWIERRVQDSGILQHLGGASDMLQHALGASQRIMMNLRPAVLDQGLVAAVQWLVQGFEKRTGIRSFLRSSQERIEVSRDVQLVAYRTAQEALTNISKYAQCSEVHIDLSDEEGMLTLEITDNGLGITPHELQKPKSFGLRGLRERAKTVGGWLDVSVGRNQEGVSIILSVPLNPYPSDSIGDPPND